MTRLTEEAVRVGERYYEESPEESPLAGAFRATAEHMARAMVPEPSDSLIADFWREQFPQDHTVPPAFVAGVRRGIRYARAHLKTPTVPEPALDETMIDGIRRMVAKRTAAPADSFPGVQIWPWEITMVVDCYRRLAHLRPARIKRLDAGELFALLGDPAIEGEPGSGDFIRTFARRIEDEIARKSGLEVDAECPARPATRGEEGRCP